LAQEYQPLRRIALEIDNKNSRASGENRLWLIVAKESARYGVGDAPVAASIALPAASLTLSTALSAASFVA